MKMVKKVDVDEVDDMLLEDLIKHCEDRMSEPYKEKAKAAIVVKEEEPEMDEAEEMEPDMEDDLDEEKKEKLRKMYEMLKD